MLITESYRELNRELHAEQQSYGWSGWWWGDIVFNLMGTHECRNALDYGSGKGTLARELGEPPWLKNYDPAIKGLDGPPKPADLVICNDVLEHIEPECVDDVLDDIARLTGKIAVLIICYQLAKKTLPDGRNTHLIVKPVTWWLRKILDRFELNFFHVSPLSRGRAPCLLSGVATKKGPKEFMCIVSPIDRFVPKTQAEFSAVIPSRPAKGNGEDND